MMTIYVARFLVTQSPEEIAYREAEWIDPDFRKEKEEIEKQIQEHQKQIRKLEEKRGRLNVKESEKLLDYGKRRLKEAKEFIKAYEEAEKELTINLNKKIRKL